MTWKKPLLIAIPAVILMGACSTETSSSTQDATPTTVKEVTTTTIDSNSKLRDWMVTTNYVNYLTDVGNAMDGVSEAAGAYSVVVLNKACHVLNNAEVKLGNISASPDAKFNQIASVMQNHIHLAAAHCITGTANNSPSELNLSANNITLSRHDSEILTEYIKSL